MFSFDNIGHAFAAGFQKFRDILHVTEKVITKVQSQEGKIEGITSLIPGAGAVKAIEIERAAFSVLGKALAIAHALDDATAAKGATVQLDATEVANLKAMIKNFSGDLATVGIVVPTKGA